GRRATAAPVAASMILPSVPVTKTLLVSGSADSRPSWSALMIGKASGLPEVATAPTASSVSENSSLANLATASSNGPARARSAKAAISRTERASVRRRSQTLANNLTTPAGVVEGGGTPAFRGSRNDLYYFSLKLSSCAHAVQC